MATAVQEPRVGDRTANCNNNRGKNAIFRLINMLKIM
jgi:hypothetical protein